MADTPKKTSQAPRKATATGGKGVALTARQALQAADQATMAPASVRKAPAGKPPVVKATAIKPAIAKKPVVKPAEAKAPAPVAPTPSAAPAVVAAAAAKKILPDVQTPMVPPVARKIEDVITPSIETKPHSEHVVHAAITEGKTTMNDVIENTKKYTEEAKTRFQSAFAEMNEKAKVSVEKSTKTMEEMTELAKGNVEAMVESGKIAAKGMEAMGQDAAEYSRLTFEKASTMMKSLAAVKSPTEFFQLQTEMLSSAFDAFAKESAKNSEAMIKLASDVAQPLSSRVSVMTDKVKSLAA